MANIEYGKLLYALIEMQKVGSELLGQFSVDHVDGNSIDPSIALPNILAQQESKLLRVPSFNYRCNKQKLYDTAQNPPVLKNPIDIAILDTTLQKDLLLYLDGFPVSKIKPGKSKKNCISCNKKKVICCARCQQCDNCNVISISNKCPYVYKLKDSLRIDKLLRNLVSHMTLKTLQNFLDGKQGFPDFPTVNTWQDLCRLFLDTMSNICDYMMDKGNFSNPSVVVLSGQDKLKKLDHLETVLNKNIKIECDINLLSNLKQILLEEHQTHIDEIGKVIDDLKGIT